MMYRSFEILDHSNGRVLNGMSLSTFPSKAQGSMWNQGLKTVRTRGGGDFKEIEPFRYNRTDIHMNSQRP